jgi:hypothetical protein
MFARPKIGFCRLCTSWLLFLEHAAISVNALATTPTTRFSMRLLYAAFLLWAALWTTRNVQAQALPAASPPLVSPRVAAPAAFGDFTRADTARAIRKLFRSRRGGGIGWLSFGTAGILASTLPALQTTSAGV